MENSSHIKLLAELNELRIQLEESNDTIEAIRSGEIDALVVKDKEGHQIFTLKSADHTYRIFIEQMTEGAVTLNQSNTILYSNSQFAKMIDIPLEKVIGQPFEKFLPQQYQGSFKFLISKAWNENVKGELKLKSRNGLNPPVLLSLKTLELDEGSSMSIILTDLSSQKETQQLLRQKNLQLEDAQKIAQELNANLENTVKERTKELEITIVKKTRAEDDLRANQDRLTRILETMAEGVVIVDVSGNLTYANPMAQKIFFINNQESLSSIYGTDKWQNLKVSGEPLTHKDHPLALMLSTEKEVYDHEIAIQPINGERFYISVNAAPIRDQNGTLTGGVVTFMDVTNRRKISQQKDEFISVASHELKTPLTSLKASMQILTRLMQSNKTSDKIPEFVEKANKNLSKVLYLTEDLMNVSKIQHGQLPLNKTRFNLTKLISDCCSHVKADDSYNFIIEGEKGVEILADFQRIDQVVVNLVNNAIKYAPESKTIRLDISRQDGVAKVSVQDFGIGISPEKLPHLFDRYYRVDPSGIQFSGLGLGLYISAEIIERHGGKIGVDSVEGEGSTFWFTLPTE
ncbi:PAS domain-containing sensor histidine kinase [Daejeonella lutea]|uniref:histidine kinase n=1 Tax=Daejeonella lutea TaxID=572036 RepID=A0A1T5DWR3_9SPHI|nr:ATP-binding protein [Daejeonella lutea]SKB76117.1 PAS domain S-box-containing protein [Daejeonella lutea]